MGQKVNPNGLRIGIIRDWDSKWYAEKDFANYLVEDDKIRKFVKKSFYDAGIAKVIIERTANIIRLSLNTAKPGMIIGKNGAGVDALRAQLTKMTGKQIFINVVEIKKPEIDAALVAENIASQLERRITYRRAMRQVMTRAMRANAQGIKVMISGRLNGAEIARCEWDRMGRIPLQTLRADIDYGVATAYTTYGQLGIKVWIYKGEVLPRK
ncbi:30S ribosomal protein S3 [Clostridium sp. 'deep sea']|uniref:30S ribosomal protein S3 n=1 Tax=Clostridium sp. 'deep sea' TaxID=2779445 RepID=UPI00189643A5|nr:30S ribosomal protein S3 [Clostridium sp. 'deep sea']QOR34584.1 30S ribosomal protein S3 [Clostridium sp. 'deep sea']